MTAKANGAAGGAPKRNTTAGRAPRRGSGKIRWIVGLIAFLLAGAALIGIIARRQLVKPYNLLLISVDTVRPDHLSYMGYDRPTSPTIDKIARGGVVFETCYSEAGWTLPAMATLLTGRYPKDHGATDFHWSMDISIPTLTNIVRANGYDTRGFVSHVILEPKYGFAEGFKRFDYSVLNLGHPHDIATGAKLTDIVIDDIADIREPYFIWVHYFDPHFAYLSHARWSAFGASDIDRYDQEIAYSDDQIGRLLDYLERRGLTKNTIVIYTSDHGEEFGEHGGAYHYTLYEEVMKVPLIIKAPFLQPGVNRTVAAQIDFLPTILEMLGIETVGDYPGRDLFSNDGGDRPIFFERDHPFPYKQRGVKLKNHKLVVVEPADTAAVPRSSRGTYSEVTNVRFGVFMYDLAQDPRELNDIYSETDPKARQLAALLLEHFGTEKPRGREVQLDEKTREKLRSLGYIR